VLRSRRLIQGVNIMPSANRLPVEVARYTMMELSELRRTMLRYSRSIPPGSERNQHLQIAISLRRLFKNKAWLEAHSHLPVSAVDSMKSEETRGWLQGQLQAPN
jgi:hypothetical protein